MNTTHLIFSSVSFQVTKYSDEALLQKFIL